MHNPEGVDWLSTAFMILGILYKGTDWNLTMSRSGHWLQRGKLRHGSIKPLALDPRAVN